MRVRCCCPQRSTRRSPRSAISLATPQGCERTAASTPTLRRGPSRQPARSGTTSSPAPPRGHQPRDQGSRPLLAERTFARQCGRTRLAPPRARRLDLVHRFGGVAAPNRRGVGARRAPEWDGLRLDPCLPRTGTARDDPAVRGSIYHIAIERDADLPEGSSASVCLDGAPVDGTSSHRRLSPASCHEVGVRCR